MFRLPESLPVELFEKDIAYVESDEPVNPVVKSAEYVYSVRITSFRLIPAMSTELRLRNTIMSVLIPQGLKLLPSMFVVTNCRERRV